MLSLSASLAFERPLRPAPDRPELRPSRLCPDGLVVPMATHKRQRTLHVRPFNPNTPDFVQAEADAESERIRKLEANRLRDAHGHEVNTLYIQFAPRDGAQGPDAQVQVPADVTLQQLNILLNELLENKESTPYAFYLEDDEVRESLAHAIQEHGSSTELTIKITYQPQAVFRVRTITRSTATIPGHTEAVLHVHFSPDGNKLVSGSGDSTVRIWDTLTQTPIHTCEGHKSWVLAVAWSPDTQHIASGSMDCDVRIWSGTTGKLVGKPYKGHKKPITSIAWEPMHMNIHSTKFATSSKDGDIRIWDITSRSCVRVLSGHTQSVTCLKWGGHNTLYSASHDRTIKVWEASTGKLLRTLAGHAHWVNHLSLNTEYALRSGPFDHHGRAPESADERATVCRTKYEAALARANNRELLVSCSDDFTLMLWDPLASKHPLIRMTGHQQPVNFVSFSPDGRYIASASFDTSVRVWNGTSGKYMATFRGHVQAVYQVCWSADSRLLVSSSKDSTMKLWDVSAKSMLSDLPGHADEVYACDWSPDGERVASGGKDQVIKIWQH